MAPIPKARRVADLAARAQARTRAHRIVVELREALDLDPGAGAPAIFAAAHAALIGGPPRKDPVKERGESGTKGSSPPGSSLNMKEQSATRQSDTKGSSPQVSGTKGKDEKGGK